MEHKIYSRKLTKKKKAIQSLKSYKNEDGSQKENKLERKVRLWLESAGIYFQQEYGIEWKKKYKSYDFLITDGLNYRFIVEVMGDYFHGLQYHEGEIPFSKLTKTQQKNIKNDKLKVKILKEKGIPLVIIWEYEIKYQFNTVINRILQEIERQNIL